MRTLQVTNAESSFFQTQLDALAHADIESEVTAPPTGVDGDRRPADYVRWLPDVHRDFDREFDLVHANYGLTAPIAASVSARIRTVSDRDVPLVVSLWGSDVMGESRVVDTVSRISAEYADAVIAPSEALAATIEADAEIVPFGVDMEQFRPMDRADARDRVDWPTDENIALFPYAPTREVKNYPLAEDVVEAADTDVTLRTISDVPYDRVPAYMNAADLVLVTSHREAGPMVVKEAAACNVPVVSTDVGFVREALDDVTNSGVGTTRSELATAVDRVLATDDRRSNGRDAGDVISIEEMGSRLRDVYHQVLDEPPRPAKR